MSSSGSASHSALLYTSSRTSSEEEAGEEELGIALLPPALEMVEDKGETPCG
jgi:hypothetical protein